MLNGDVLTDIDLTAELEQHKKTNARATIALIPVEDPSAYGLVRLNGDNSVNDFVEKPSPDQIDTDLINAGVYVLKRDVLSIIPENIAVSIEREVFPELIRDGLYGYPAQGYWLDIGTPERYLEATVDILEGNVKTAVQKRLDGSGLYIGDNVEVNGRVVAPALIESDCRLAVNSRVGGRAVLGHNVEIGENSVIESAVIFSGAKIGENCRIHSCIIAGGAQIEDHTHIEGGVVLGEGVTIGAHNFLASGMRIAPGVSLPKGAITF